MVKTFFMCYSFELNYHFKYAGFFCDKRQDCKCFLKNDVPNLLKVDTASSIDINKIGTCSEGKGKIFFSLIFTLLPQMTRHFGLLHVDWLSGKRGGLCLKMSDIFLWCIVDLCPLFSSNAFHAYFLARSCITSPLIFLFLFTSPPYAVKISEN